MHSGSNRATAIALSTILLAILLASSFLSIPIVHGQSATVSPKDYPIFCGSTGNLDFTFDTEGQTWRGVAIEIPKEFGGLADGDASKVYAPSITYDPRFISVYNEELYYPYNREYSWVQICADPTDHPTWPGITGTAVTVTLKELTAPSIARDYTINLYYTYDHFPCTYNLPIDFSDGDGNLGVHLQSVTVKVHMGPEASTISGTVYDASSPSLTLNAGYVTATANRGTRNKEVVAKTTIASDGSYTLTGLCKGTYTLTAWGKRTDMGTVTAYTPTDLPSPITVEKHETLTGIDLAVNKGGEINGYVRLYDYDGTTPITPNDVFAGYFTLPSDGLPVRLELLDSTGTIVWDTTVYVPVGASFVSYSIKELYDHQGIPTGTYTLKAYAFGFVHTAPVSVSVTAPGAVTIDVAVVKGGGVGGTLYYLTAQGITHTLTADTTILVEVFDLAGALKGVWIGTALAGQSYTPFLIRGTGESITPVAGYGFTTVTLKTYSGRGVKDSGLPDGGYIIRVSVKGFVQQEPYPMAVISYAGTSSVSIYMKQGGAITGIIYARDPTGVYAETWQRATPPPWEYDSAVTQTRIRAYIYDATGSELGYATTYQDWATQIAFFIFNGRARSTAYLQCGYKQTALADGTYTIKVYTWGYWQLTPYPEATIYYGGTQVVNCYMIRGGVIAGTITFKEAGVSIPVTGLAKVEAVDTEEVTQGAAFYSLQAAQSLTYYLYGKYRYGKEFDGGLVDGTYSVKLTLKEFTHPTQTVTIYFGGTVVLNFDAYRMGMVTGAVRGEVTYQPEPVPLSWVKVTLRSQSPPHTEYTTYSADGVYSTRVPDGTYRIEFSVPGYKTYKVKNVVISSGTTQVINVALEELHDP